MRAHLRFAACFVAVTAGCGGPSSADVVDVSLAPAPPAPSASSSPDTSASSFALSRRPPVRVAGDLHTGMPQCDVYLQKLLANSRCLPPEARDNLRASLAELAVSWREMSKDPSSRRSMEDACSSAAASANQMCP
ncbi:MAG: hypothetical protein U0271_12890 [Polyangiaceae bacterium]